MDLPARIEVSRLGWIRRILGTPTTTSADMIRNILNQEDISTTFSAKHPAPMPPQKHSPFYLDLLLLWHRVHCHPPSDENEVRAEVLWDNIFISSPTKMLHRQDWCRWVNAGVMQIHDICHSHEDRLMGHIEINNSFGVDCNFLQALTLRHSIPYSWRRMITPGFQGEVPYRFLFKIQDKQFDLLNSSPKTWYTYMWNGLSEHTLPSTEPTNGSEILASNNSLIGGKSSPSHTRLPEKRNGKHLHSKSYIDSYCADTTST